MTNLLETASLGHCELCPRRCGANRAAGACGVCGADDSLKIARAALHYWEEPPISGERGSGTIFFSGCPLKCVYCQNHEISTGGFGIEVAPGRLVEIMLELQEQGAHNINLVTATHYAHLLPTAIGEARRRGLSIPIVYNTSGYEREELSPSLPTWSTSGSWTTNTPTPTWAARCPMSSIIPRRRHVPCLACAPRWPPAGESS